MRLRSFPVVVFAIVSSLLTAVTPATAAIETWVSGSGVDTGTCTIAAPCKTFAFALTRTTAGGTINVLAPGNFGPVTINKAVNIVADSVEALITTAGADGAAIKIQAPSSAVVSLRGLTIESFAGRGVDFIAGAALYVDKCAFHKLNTGIVFEPNAGVPKLYVADTVITDSVSNGIFITSASGGSIRAVIDGVEVKNGGGPGLNFMPFTMGTFTATVSRSTVSGFTNSGISAQIGGGGFATVMLDRTTITNNGIGVSTSGPVMRIGDSTVTGNTTGLQASGGGGFGTYGTNQIDGNHTNVVGSFAPISMK